MPLSPGKKKENKKNKEKKKKKIKLFPFSPPYFTLVPYFSSHSPHPFTQTYCFHPSLFFFPFSPPIHSNILFSPFSLFLPIHPTLFHSRSLMHPLPHPINLLTPPHLPHRPQIPEHTTKTKQYETIIYFSFTVW